MNPLSPEEAYERGFEDGITAYAWWKDGVLHVGTLHVGTCGTTLREARAKMPSTWNYAGPKSAVKEEENESKDQGGD